MTTTLRPTNVVSLLMLALALAGLAGGVRLAAGSIATDAGPAIGSQPDITSSQDAVPAEASSDDGAPLAVPPQPALGSAGSSPAVTTSDAKATSTTAAQGSASSSDGRAAAPSRWSEWPNDMPPPAVGAPSQAFPKRPLPQNSP
jgi:hypothetical protein